MKYLKAAFNFALFIASLVFAKEAFAVPDGLPIWQVAIGFVLLVRGYSALGDAVESFSK